MNLNIATNGRSRLVPALLVLALAQPSVALASGLNGRVLALDEKGRITGIVPGANIEFKNQAGQVAARVSADQRGYYKINLAPATYTYKVQAAGFKDEDVGRGITVKSTKGYATYNFSLAPGKTDPKKKPVPPLPEVALLQGRVQERTADGKFVDIPGAKIALRKTGSLRLIEVFAQAAGSKNPGHYEVVLVAGSYQASVSAAGFDTFVDPSPITITTGRTTRNFVLTRSQPKSLEGIQGIVTLKQPRGPTTTWPRVTLSIRPLGAQPGGGVSLTLDPSGKYKRDFRPGRYQVVAEAVGYQTAYSGPADVFAGHYTTVNLQLVPITTPDTEPKKDYFVVATVYESPSKTPVSAATVLLRKKGEPLAGAQRGKTNQAGRTILKVAQPGSYEALATHEGYKPAAVPVEIRSPGETRVDIVLVKSKEPIPDKVAVPRVIDLIEKAAEGSLERVGLRVGKVVTIDEATTNPQLIGVPKVAAQAPMAGTMVLRGAAVDLTLKKYYLAKKDTTPTDKPKVQVPDVRGQTVKVAYAMLKRADLQLGKVTVVDEATRDPQKLAPPKVTLQSPAAGMLVPKGTAVDVTLKKYYLAKGSDKKDTTPTDKPKVQVPDVRGLTQKAAQAMLERVELRLGKVTVVDEATRDPQKLGFPKVTMQSPSAGMMVPQGTPVDVTLKKYFLAKGTDKKDTSPTDKPKVQVPDVRGLTQKAAQAMLERVELRLGKVTVVDEATRDPQKLGFPKVTMQSPPAGMMVPQGTAVDVTLKKYFLTKGAGKKDKTPTDKPKVQVPDVRGLTQKAAQAMLERVELRLGKVTVVEEATRDPQKVAAPRVTLQTPAAGTLVPQGTPVDVTLKKYHLAKGAPTDKSVY